MPRRYRAVLRFAHQIFCLVARLFERERVCHGRGVRREGCIEFFAECSHPRAELRAEIALANLYLLEFRKDAHGGFIARVGGDERVCV